MLALIIFEANQVFFCSQMTRCCPLYRLSALKMSEINWLVINFKAKSHENKTHVYNSHSNVFLFFFFWFSAKVSLRFSQAFIVRQQFQTSLLKSVGQLGPISIFSLLGPGMIACLYGSSLLTKMATMPIYGKNILKIHSPESRNWGPWNLMWSIENLENLLKLS